MSSDSRTIRVLICDDQTLVSEGLAAILSTAGDVTVIATASNGLQALEQATLSKPDVVLMDLNMPVMNGVRATREILAVAPETAVLVLTTYAADEWLFDALRAGARGYLLKDTRRDELLRAIRTVAGGGAVLDPAVAARVMQQAARAPAAAEVVAGQKPLTDREREILQLVSMGRGNAEIAAMLHLTHGTVRNYVSEIIAKLGAADRTQAVVLATQRGLL